MFSKIVIAVISVYLFIMGNGLLGPDFLPFIQWWMVILVLGLCFLPVSNKLFSSFKDKGYLFSKTIGIAVTGYIMWIFSSLHIMKFTESSCIISLGLGLAINIAILYYKKRKNGNFLDINIIQQGDMKLFVKEELLFFVVFLAFTYIRGFKPEAYGTEKFMDYGFMTSMMRSEYMPPQDFWFSGTSLNYYYVGQYIATFLTKLSFVEVTHGYNLMLMMVGAFAFVLPFSIVFNLMHYTNKQGRSIKAWIPTLSGVLAGIAVCIAGNMHYPIYRWILPFIRKEQYPIYWFSDPTRYIGYNPDTNDKTIHEFPSYSFVLGDLHAHVINIMFVLTILAILIAWLHTHNQEKDRAKELTIKDEIFNPGILMITFFIGLFHTTNFWDFPIYYVVSGAVILFSNMIVYNFKGKAYWLTAIQGVFIFLMAEVLFLPFRWNFDQISSLPCIATNHTPLYQLAVLWGLPIATVVFFISCVIANHRRNSRQLLLNSGKKNNGKNNVGNNARNNVRQNENNNINNKVKNNAIKDVKVPAIISFMKSLEVKELFIITIGLCAMGLILLPELIYIQDIYSGDYKRANTMFKLTYQAFIMFGICFGYIIPRLLLFGKTLLQRAGALISLVLLILTVFYAGYAVKAWYGDISDEKGYKGLDAAAFVEEDMPEDYLAIKWLNDNVSGSPVVLEANGESYSDYQRVSVITGLPTLLGWRTHEWLWKSRTDILNERAADIQTIYTSENLNEVKDLVDRYDISYIYLGKLEYRKFNDMNLELLQSLGSTVYESIDTYNGHRTYIIKVSR